MKICSRCNIEKHREKFHKNRSSKDGLYSICKACKNVKNKQYKINNLEEERIRNQCWYADNIDHKRQYYKKYYIKNKYRYHLASLRRLNQIKRATLSDYRQEVDIIYKNRPKGHHVDHIVPLQGETVCGLHVPWNLQYLTVEANLSKGNKLIEV